MRKTLNCNQSANRLREQSVISVILPEFMTAMTVMTLTGTKARARIHVYFGRGEI